VNFLKPHPKGADIYSIHFSANRSPTSLFIGPTAGNEKNACRLDLSYVNDNTKSVPTYLPHRQYIYLFIPSDVPLIAQQDIYRFLQQLGLIEDC